jgi:pilus assembly protein CpaB
MRRFRYRLGRHPVGFWAITWGLAGLTALTVFRVQARADAVVERWGRLVPVVVVAPGPGVDMGAEVLASDVRLLAMPARLVPAGALRSVADVEGRWALTALSPGEVVLRRRLAPDGVRGVTALVPDGMRAVAVPAGEGGLRVEVGDAVDVLATSDDANAGAGAEPTVVVAESALVVEVRPDAITLAVPPDAAARIATALPHTTLTLTLRKSTATGAVDYLGGTQ